MRVIAFSDSHGDRGRLREAVEQALLSGPVDVCVHCGDGARDIDTIALILRERNPQIRLYAVKGNADFCEFGMPTLELFEVNGARMIATHGHLFNVKSELDSLLSAAEARALASQAVRRARAQSPAPTAPPTRAVSDEPTPQASGMMRNSSRAAMP